MLVTLSISDTISDKLIIFTNPAKTLFQAAN